jgi:hypothetical protein
LAIKGYHQAAALRDLGDEGLKRRLFRERKKVAINEKKVEYYWLHLTKKSSTKKRGGA